MGTSIIHPTAKIGKGSVVEAFCVIGENVTIGKNAKIRAGTIIYKDNKIGDNFQTGNKANIRENNTIGNNVSIGTLSVVEHHVTIEDNVRIHTQVFVPEFSVLKKGCWLGPNVVLTNAFHPLCPNAKNCLHGVTIGESAKIGANTTILPGVKIGKDALIGAGSLVIKDVKDGMVAAGHPAKDIKKTKDLKCKSGKRKGPYC